MIGSSDGEERKTSDVVSIVGPGMTVQGDCSTDGTLRVEGRVKGAVHAAKAVVVGEEGEVVGDVHTQDAVVAGRVEGSITAESRVELQASARVEGDIRSRKVKLEEGGIVQGRLEMGEDAAGPSPGAPDRSPQAAGAGTPAPGEDA